MKALSESGFIWGNSKFMNCTATLEQDAVNRLGEENELD